MPIKDILIRSMSGFVFLIPAIVIYVLYFKKVGKKLPPLHIIVLLIFCYYIIGILTMTGIGKLYAFSPKFVLIPTEDLIKGTIDTMLNIILFIPLGFMLPFMYKKYKSFGKVVLAGFLLSLSIEIIQMFGRGATDINDLITNTLGTVLGYLLFKVMEKVIQKKLPNGIQTDKINATVEIVLFVVLSFIVMITIQAWFISKFFRLG